MSPKAVDAGWLQEMPSWVRVFMQLGFAGVFALLYVFDSRDRSMQLRELQTESRTQARDDRILFQSEMKAQRESLTAAVNEMKLAIQVISDQHRKLKMEVDDIRNPIPAPKAKFPE